MSFLTIAVMEIKAQIIKPGEQKPLQRAGFGLAKIKAKWQREWLALLWILGLHKDRYANLRFSRTSVFALRKNVRGFRPLAILGRIPGFALRVSAAALVGIIISVPFMQAFEAHIINVTAIPILIDPPVLAQPGDIGWDNPDGGVNLIGNQDIILSDADPDATHIFYTYGPGTDPNVIANPVCGGALGGPKDAPQHLVISSDTTIKSIACDDGTAAAHFSLINTKIYTFVVPCRDRFIPLDVMVVFDRSGSMLTGGKLAGAKTAAKDFIDVLNPARDQAGLVSFSTSAALNEQLTNDFAGVKTAVDALTASGATNIGDAISKANIEMLSARARSNSTKVEILLTDGRANRPGATDDNPTAVALAQTQADVAAANGFLLYTIGLGADVNAPFLTDLAHRTGGEYFSSADIGQLSDVYNQISHLICGQGKISGLKFNDLNQNGSKDPGEPGVAGWRITLKHGSGTFGVALTDADGNYEFTDLPANVPFTLVEESRSGWQSINPASGQIDVTLNSDGQILTGQNFANFESGQQCLAEPISFPSGVAILAAGKNEGDVDNVVISANVTVNGTVQSNDDVKASGGGSTRLVNGDIIAGDEVENPGNFTVSGSVLEHQPSASLPDVHIPLWKNLAKDGGTVNGSLIFPANTHGIDIGPTEIMGNLSFGSGNIATVKGPLYIHGNLTIGANTTITQDSSFGNNFVMIIVDGIVSINSNVSFVGSGSSGAFLLVSTADPVLAGSIQASSNNSDLGRVVLFASQGNVHIHSNRTVLGVFAKAGISEDSEHHGGQAPAIDLDSNVTVSGGVFPQQIACGPALSPDQSLKHVLVNEFMSNPSGNDAGLQPNGEWVELYNNTAATVNVNGWVLTNNITPDIGTAQIQTWESSADFAGGTFNHTFTENSGNQRVRVSTGFTSGTYEKVFDAGSGKKGIWQNFAWSSLLSAGAGICMQAATSDDNITYTPYSASDCASPFDATPLPESRFIKWRSTQTRTTGAVSNNADLLDAVLSYKPASFGELVIIPGITNTGNTTIAPAGHLVVYRNGNTNFILDNSGGSVTLWDGHPLFGAGQIDSHIYISSGIIPEGKSFTRMPDGTANWVDPEATPGGANVEFVSSNTAPDAVPTFVSPPDPVPEVLQEPQPGESDYIEPSLDLNQLADITATSSTSTLETVLGDSTTTPSSEATTTPVSSSSGLGGGGPSTPEVPPVGDSSATSTPDTSASSTPPSGNAPVDVNPDAAPVPPADPPATDPSPADSPAPPAPPANEPAPAADAGKNSSSNSNPPDNQITAVVPPAIEPQAPPPPAPVADPPQASN